MAHFEKIIVSKDPNEYPHYEWGPELNNELCTILEIELSNYIIDFHRKAHPEIDDIGSFVNCIILYNSNDILILKMDFPIINNINIESLQEYIRKNISINWS